MSRLLARELPHDLARLLAPHTRRTEQEEHARYEDLQARGFIVLYSKRVAELQRLGAATARVRADGARWPLLRASVDNYAFMAHKDDHEFFERLTHAVNGGVHAKSGEDLTRAVDMLVATLHSRGQFDPMRVAALEVVVRLGDTAAVMAFLAG